MAAVTCEQTLKKCKAANKELYVQYVQRGLEMKKNGLWATPKWLDQYFHEFMAVKDAFNQDIRDIFQIPENLIVSSNVQNDLEALLDSFEHPLNPHEIFELLLVFCYNMRANGVPVYLQSLSQDRVGNATNRVKASIQTVREVHAKMRIVHNQVHSSMVLFVTRKKNVSPTLYSQLMREAKKTQSIMTLYNLWTICINEMFASKNKFVPVSQDTLKIWE